MIINIQIPQPRDFYLQPLIFNYTIVFNKTSTKKLHTKEDEYTAQ